MFSRYELKEGDLVFFDLKSYYQIIVDEFFVIFSGIIIRFFCDYEKDVMSVVFLVDNRQIVFGFRDKFIKLWNIFGVCKYIIQVRYIYKVVVCSSEKLLGF